MKPSGAAQPRTPGGWGGASSTWRSSPVRRRYPYWTTGADRGRPGFETAGGAAGPHRENRPAAPGSAGAARPAARSLAGNPQVNRVAPRRSAGTLGAVRRRTFLKIIAGLPATAGISALPGCGGGDGSSFVLTTPTRPPLDSRSASPTPSPVPLDPPEFVLSATEVYQAGAILVSLVGPAASGRATFLGRGYDLIQGSQSIFSFVGVDCDDPTGPADLRVEFTLTNGTTGSLTQPIEVLPVTWPVDAIDIPEEKTNLLDPAIAAAEAQILQQFYGVITREKLWDNMTWRIPTPGDITTQMGEQRSYNGSEPSGHHAGTDFGAEEGTPVGATNRGRVVMARQTRVHGNMVIVDHGGAVMSGYAHLSAFAVAEGQIVAGGDVVGYVGTTGLSTGAHLHWEITVGGVNVDPMRFTDGTNGF